MMEQSGSLRDLPSSKRANNTDLYERPLEFYKKAKRDLVLLAARGSTETDQCPAWK
jgi:hypothetical protein